VAGSIKDQVRIYKIVHALLHFESEAPQGGETDEGTVVCCQRVRRAPRLPHRTPDGRFHEYYGGVYELHAVGDDPVAAMELWIRETLRGSAGLEVEVSTRINPGPLTPGTALPAVTWVQCMDPVDIPGAGGVIMAVRAQYRVCVVA